MFISLLELLLFLLYKGLKHLPVTLDLLLERKEVSETWIDGALILLLVKLKERLYALEVELDVSSKFEAIRPLTSEKNYEVGVWAFQCSFSDKPLHLDLVVAH